MGIRENPEKLKQSRFFQRMVSLVRVRLNLLRGFKTLRCCQPEKPDLYVGHIVLHRRHLGRRFRVQQYYRCM